MAKKNERDGSKIRRPLVDRRMSIGDPFEIIPVLFGGLRKLSPLFGQPSWPEIDIKEEKNQLVVKADVPGVEEENLEVSVSENSVTISGEREEESEKKVGRFLHKEKSFGSFSRTLRLPSPVDRSKARAELKKGVLKLTIPKLKAKPAPDVTKVKIQSEPEKEK